MQNGIYFIVMCERKSDWMIGHAWGWWPTAMLNSPTSPAATIFCSQPGSRGSHWGGSETMILHPTAGGLLFFIHSRSISLSYATSSLPWTSTQCPRPPRSHRHGLKKNYAQIVSWSLCVTLRKPACWCPSTSAIPLQILSSQLRQDLEARHLGALAQAPFSRVVQTEMWRERSPRLCMDMEVSWGFHKRGYPQMDGL